jgi:hypothetical protein
MCVPLQYYLRMLAVHSTGTSYPLTDFPRDVRFGRPTPALRLVTGGQPFHAGGYARDRAALPFCYGATPCTDRPTDRATRTSLPPC